VRAAAVPPGLDVRYLVDRLRQADSPLTELSAGDRSVAEAFALSYEIWTARCGGCFGSPTSTAGRTSTYRRPPR
jgi:hypothetical protein